MDLTARRLIPADTPAIRTVPDLHQHWRRLMGPLGFASRHLWVAAIDHDGRAQPVLPKVEDVPAIPDPREVATLLRAFAAVFDAHPGSASLALLLARPGGGEPTAADLRWAACLTAQGRCWQVPLWPTFLATSTAITELIPSQARTQRGPRAA